MKISSKLLPVILLVTPAISACSQSALDRCIDAQMSAWEKDDALRAKLSSVHRSDAPPVEIGGVKVPADLMPTTIDEPVDREHAMAAANLKCGRIYGGK